MELAPGTKRQRIRRFACRHAVLSSIVIGLATICVAQQSPVNSAQGIGGMASVVELYNAKTDHYFITQDPEEVRLRTEVFPFDWMRTGNAFPAYQATPDPYPPTAIPVCRFYGLPEAGLDSHFFSMHLDECALLRQPGSGWIEESSDVFGMELPNSSTGACLDGQVAVYRLWNKRHDSNHRYTTSLHTRQLMLDLGWVSEGFGPAGVAMCSPAPAIIFVPAARPSALG